MLWNWFDRKAVWHASPASPRLCRIVLMEIASSWGLAKCVRKFKPAHSASFGAHKDPIGLGHDRAECLGALWRSPDRWL